MSPSSRRAWIEIKVAQKKSETDMVALLAEGVDRNMKSAKEKDSGLYVALLAEGVDRN